MNFFSTRHVKAGRKKHRCDCCSRSIALGEPSIVQSGIVEGDFQSSRTCAACDQFISRHIALGNIDIGEPYYFTDLAEIARESGEPWPPQPEREAA